VRLALLLALAPLPDRWFGADKVKHFFMTAFAQSVAYSTLRAVGTGRDASLVAASAATATVSVAKELHDRPRPEGFSVRDLVWDAAGAGAATLILYRTVP